MVFGGLEVAHFAPGCDARTPEVLAWAIGALFSIAAVVLPPAAAYQAACTVWLALHGVAAWAMGAVLQWPRPQRWVVAIAIECSALGLMFFNSGRIEHLVLPWFCIAVVGMVMRSPWLGGLVAAAGLGLAAQSSPYQAVPGGLLLLSIGAAQGWRGLGRAVGASVLAAAPILVFWDHAAHSEGGDMFLIPLGVLELLWDPQPWSDRIADLSPKPFSAFLQTAAPASEQYIGVVLAVGGIAGALRCWRQPLGRAALACAVACAVLGLGYQLRLTTEGEALAWMPWAWLSQISTLAPMMNTNRFLTGAVFACALGLGMLAGPRPRLAAGLCAALLLETTLLAPHGWPAEVIRLDPRTLPAAASERGPLLLWPPDRWLPNGIIDIIAVETEQDVLVLTDWTCGQPAVPLPERLAWAEEQGAQILELTEEVLPGSPPAPAEHQQAIDRGTEAVLWPMP